MATFIVETMTGLAFERYGANEVQISCFNENTAGLLLYPKLGFVPYAIEERSSLGERPIGPHTHDAQQKLDRLKTQPEAAIQAI